MKALIVTNIQDEYFKENNFLNIKAFDVVSNINKLLPKFDFIIFIVNNLNTFENNIHKSLEIDKCKKDFYIFKKEKNHNLFKNNEFKELLTKKEINTIYISGFYLEYEVKNLALSSIKSNYKTVVIEDTCMLIDENINKTLKIFKEANINFIESFELEQFEK